MIAFRSGVVWRVVDEGLAMFLERTDRQEVYRRRVRLEMSIERVRYVSSRERPKLETHAQ